jgi:hypothetical protein
MLDTGCMKHFGVSKVSIRINVFGVMPLKLSDE